MSTQEVVKAFREIAAQMEKALYDTQVEVAQARNDRDWAYVELAAAQRRIAELESQ